MFTPTEMAFFRKELVSRRKRLVSCLQSQRVVNAWMIPLVGCTAERDVDRRTIETERKLLHEIDAALRRLDTGAFGLCTHCEQPIRVSQLNAAPATHLCRTCSVRSVTPGLDVRKPSTDRLRWEPVT